MTEITERVVKEALLKQRARTMATIYLTEMYCKWRPQITETQLRDIICSSQKFSVLLTKLEYI